MEGNEQGMKRKPPILRRSEPAPAPEDERESRELAAEENATLCRGCVKCCTYITIEVDPPRQSWEYDQWIWMLHHQGINLYVEKPEKWYVHVETVCRQLNSDGRCAIHGRHPVLCRNYDPRTCERRLPLLDIRAWFNNAEEFEDWIRVVRPVHWERLLRYRNDMPAAPPIADAHRPGVPALVTIEGVGTLTAGAGQKGGAIAKDRGFVARRGESSAGNAAARTAPRRDRVHTG
jgi:hypothetical protein